MSNELAVRINQSMLAPGNFEHWQRIATMMSKSEMVPKAYAGKMQDILLAMEFGVSLGLAPLQAVQNIAVINGRPCLYGDAVLAVCSGHPEFENIKEEPVLGKENEIAAYRCSVKRRGRDVVTQVFTVEQAKEAGLWGKPGPWKNYPARMLQMRARAFALRDSFSDALFGVRVAEEVTDYIDVTEASKKVASKQNQDAKQELEAALSEAKK